MVQSVLFCGFATALGWGLRGEFGGSDGAMIPGALLGLSLALTSRRQDWLRKASLFGMAGTLGMALGGVQSYGRIIGYTKGVDFGNVVYGYAALGWEGGLWGAFAAGVMAFVASPKRYRIWQVILFVAAGFLLGLGIEWLLVDTFGWRLTPPRGDGWTRVLGGVLALLGFAALKRDALPARMVFWGFAAGSIGFTVGESFQVLGSNLGPAYDWWKVMEQSFGFILGAGIAYGFHRECDGVSPSEAPPLPLHLFAIGITAWYMPWVTFRDVVGKIREEEVLTASSDDADFGWHWQLRAFIILALLIVVLWRVYRVRPYVIEPRGLTYALLLWTVWSTTLLGLVKKSLPQLSWPANYVHAGFLIIAMLVSVWSLFGFVPSREKGLTPIRPRMWLWATVYVVIYGALVPFITFLSIESRPDEGGLPYHERFPVTLPEDEA